MKKFISLILCPILLLSALIYAQAFEIKYYAADPPEIFDTQFSDSEGDRTYNITYTSAKSGIEEIRKLLHDTAKEGYGSEEMLEKSPDAYLCKKTYNYCEISIDGESWLMLGDIPDGKFSFSLYSDILPLLSRSSTDLIPLTGGFDFYVRILTASENHTDENTPAVFVYKESEIITLRAPSFRFIHCTLPEDTVFSQPLPLYYSEELKDDIILSSPERKGYIFDGWSADGNTRINRIPRDSVGINLQAHWIPMVYEINYKLTTNIQYNFGRADNSDNPVSYTVGTAQPIYDIRPPVTGFVFDGWYYTEDFSGEKVTEIAEGETGDKILYAKWLSFEDIEKAKREAREKFMTDNKYGDPDGDGKVTAADARFVLRASVGLEEYSYETLKRVDYYNNNTVTAANARITLRLSVGLDNLYDILLENGVFPE